MVGPVGGFQSSIRSFTKFGSRIVYWRQNRTVVANGLDGSQRGVVTGKDAGSTPGDDERKGDQTKPDQMDSRNPGVFLPKWKCEWEPSEDKCQLACQEKNQNGGMRIQMLDAGPVVPETGRAFLFVGLSESMSLLPVNVPDASVLPPA